MVMTRSTIGGTITQNFVQNGIFIPPFVVPTSIEKKSKEINKKWHTYFGSEIVDTIAKNAKRLFYCLHLFPFEIYFQKPYFHRSKLLTF
jgi:hypothetical protein